MKTITRSELDVLEPGAVLLDCREPGEFRGQRMAGSVNVPLSRLEEGASALKREEPVVVLCQSGARSRDAARRLEALGFADVRVLQGGLAACGGLEQGPGGVWPMERQVRLGAGIFVLLGAALAWTVHPSFWLLSVGVGAGLVFSALTNTCGMALVLARMPWNR